MNRYILTPMCSRVLRGSWLGQLPQHLTLVLRILRSSPILVMSLLKQGGGVKSILPNFHLGMLWASLFCQSLCYIFTSFLWMGLGRHPVAFLCMWLPSVSNTIYCGDCCFPVLYPWCFVVN